MVESEGTLCPLTHKKLHFRYSVFSHRNIENSFGSLGLGSWVLGLQSSWIDVPSSGNWIKFLKREIQSICYLLVFSTHTPSIFRVSTAKRTFALLNRWVWKILKVRFSSLSAKRTHSLRYRRTSLGWFEFPAQHRVLRMLIKNTVTCGDTRVIFAY